ncbi:Tn3 family transposase [Nonomuraea jiangxiensis]|uniref:Tn3 family transposase n=1 Tax=Nonomuraea jiangxiensis TaxID=633440 RepID=UPI001C40AEBB
MAIGRPERATSLDRVHINSDLVFGLFAICGYQFSPRIADLADMRLWRTNTAATYGPLEHMSRLVRLDRICAHWGDMLRVAGSLTMGTSGTDAGGTGQGVPALRAVDPHLGASGRSG